MKARQALDAVIAEIAGGDPHASIERVVAEGPAGQVLVEAAKEADLLVVGSRGHGGFAGLLLGSVSQQCAHHASCAIVIVRRRGPSNRPPTDNAASGSDGLDLLADLLRY